MPLRVSCPGPLLCLACLGGGRPGPGSPLSGLGLCAPRGAGPGRSCAGGQGELGGCGAAHAPRPPFVRPGGPVGRGVALPRSVPLPSLGRQQSGCWSWGAWPPYRSGSCLPAFSGRGPCGVLARWRGFACSPRFLWESAAGAGGRAVLRLPSPALRSCWGEGGPSPLPRWGGGRRPRGLRAGGGRGGGFAPRPPCSPSGGRPAIPYPGPPLVVGAFPPGVRVPSGSRGRPVHRLRRASRGGGGMRGGPSTASPGAPSDLNPPSALPDWAMVMGGSWGARPPYCSGALPRADPGLGPRAAPARWCGLAHRPRPPREQAGGGAGVRGVQVRLRPHPPRRGPFWGRGGVSSAPGGPRVGAPATLKPGGEGGGGGGGAASPPPAPSGVGLPSVVNGVPPRGILVPWGLPGSHGHRARPGWPPMDHCGWGGGGRGGVIPSPWFAPPPSPGRPLKEPLRVRCPKRRQSAVGGQRVGRERAGGSRGALAAAALLPHAGCSGLSGGGAGALSLRPASINSWA